MLIDPEGTLAELAANTTPVHLTERVIYLDPADYAYPKGFNILAELATVEEKDRLTADICAVYDAIYPAADGTITRVMSGLLCATASGFCSTPPALRSWACRKCWATTSTGAAASATAAIPLSGKAGR